MKRIFSIILSLLLVLSGNMALAQDAPPEPPTAAMQQDGAPPEKPEGQAPGGQPPEGPAPDGQGGTPPDMPGGQMPGGAPGGNNKPDSYEAVTTVTEDTTLTGDMTSAGTDENAVLVSGGTLTLTDATVSRTSTDSTGGDAASFYGVGAAVLATAGTARISNTAIATDASGGTGVFAYGDGIVYIQDSTITTKQNTSGGIHVAGGGTLYAKNLTVDTAGESAAAIRSDRGSGTMVVDGGSYTSAGVGSPAVYVTADITINDAALTATGSEALCLEGLNSVRMYDCALSGSMQDLSQNDNTWTVILYQSMSGDSEIGEGYYEMVGGSLTSTNGGLFYTTNTESEFVLSGVTIEADNADYFLRCTGNANQRGWGQSGQNGADCRFTAIAQQMNGNVIWDSISTLHLYVTQGSALNGAVVLDDSYAAGGSGGSCTVTLDGTSTWIVTGDSTVTMLENAGSIVDADGLTVTIQGTDGTVFVQGDSPYTITAAQYKTECDLTQAGTTASFSDYAVEF